MKNEKYLLDTNSFITPYKKYYPFDFAPGFWIQLENQIINRQIIILDLVKEEIMKCEDELSDWIRKFEKSLILSRKDQSVIQVYAEVLDYVQKCGYYKEKALQEWAKEEIADAWLIAAAKTYDYTIITLETHNNNLNTTIKASRAKIPDVAKVFGVRCEDLFQLMRHNSFKL